MSQCSVKKVSGLVCLSCALSLFMGCVVQESSQVTGIHHVQALDLVDKGTLLLRNEMLDEAEAAFQLAVDIGQLPAGYDGIGSVAFSRGEYERAARYFWRAYESDRKYSNALGNLALLYEALGFPERAAEFYERAMVHKPDDARLRNNYALFLVTENQHPNGVTFREKEGYTELKKAQLLADHPSIDHNLQILGADYGTRTR